MQDLSDSRDCAFEAFITNLGKYNEGYLVGEWVKFPITNEEMQEVLSESALTAAMRNGSLPITNVLIPTFMTCSENTKV